jgi:hypothetical protein
MTVFDSPWKEILDLYLEQFFAFFFARIHAEIDWARGYEPLDKELQQIVRELGRRTVDKLVKVWRTTGEVMWVLVHIEVQAQEDPDFPQRTYVYNYRLFDRYNQMVVSLAVLADDQPDWHPDRFDRALWGCSLEFRFPAVKLLDFADKWQELETHPNPFATVVLAHLKTLETQKQTQVRLEWKVRLVKGLYERGFTAQDIRNLFRFIDWIMALPKDLESLYLDEIEQFEKEKHMPYVTSAERRGLERGERKGLLDAIAITLNIRFGADGLALLPEIQELDDIERLRDVLEAIQTASSLDEARQALV